MEQFNFRTDTDLICEAGLYSLIFNSKLKTAKIFRDKVFEEVLPSIRKTGEYKLQEKINVLNSKYSKLQLTHENILKRRTREDYKCGNVIYIVSHEAFTAFYKTFYFKIGKARQKKTVVFVWFSTYLKICIYYINTKHNDNFKPGKYSVVKYRLSSL
jgi:hypothetical protein